MVRCASNGCGVYFPASSVFAGQTIFKELYILGMLKIGPVKDYEEWLENRVEEEYQKVMDDDDDMSQSRPLLRRCKGADKVLLQALVALALMI